MSHSGGAVDRLVIGRLGPLDFNVLSSQDVVSWVQQGHSCSEKKRQYSGHTSTPNVPPVLSVSTGGPGILRVHA